MIRARENGYELSALVSALENDGNCSIFAFKFPFSSSRDPMYFYEDDDHYRDHDNYDDNSDDDVIMARYDN
jgi:hypothetical protein